MDKKDLSERDICTKLIIPAIVGAGWKTRQFREEVQLTHGRVVVRGRLACRVSNPKATGGPKRADCVLYADNGIPIAVIEAKRNIHPLGHGMQQALYYAELLDAPFAISSNGDGFLLHDRTGITQPTERDLALDAFPSYDELWAIYLRWKGIETQPQKRLIAQPFHADSSGKEPRYYQRVAINRTVEAISRGQQRILLVMATGTGKTYTAFQIIWRLWKAKRAWMSSAVRVMGAVIARKRKLCGSIASRSGDVRPPTARDRARAVAVVVGTPFVPTTTISKARHPKAIPHPAPSPIQGGTDLGLRPGEMWRRANRPLARPSRV
jgi:hypothetical protein